MAAAPSTRGPGPPVGAVVGIVCLGPVAASPSYPKPPVAGGAGGLASLFPLEVVIIIVVVISTGGLAFFRVRIVVFVVGEPVSLVLVGLATLVGGLSPPLVLCSTCCGGCLTIQCKGRRGGDAVEGNHGLRGIGRLLMQLLKVEEGVRAQGLLVILERGDRGKGEKRGGGREDGKKGGAGLGEVRGLQGVDSEEGILVLEGVEELLVPGLSTQRRDMG